MKKTREERRGGGRERGADVERRWRWREAEKEGLVLVDAGHHDAVELERHVPAILGERSRTHIRKVLFVQGGVYPASIAASMHPSTLGSISYHSVS